MTLVQDIRSIESGLVARIAAFAKGLREAHDRRRVYNLTVRELSVLSDRDLADMGIHRSTITDVAREAAYGK